MCSVMVLFAPSLCYLLADHIAQPLSWLERATSLLRICSFAGLLFAIGVIVHQKNTYLGVLVVVTIGIVVYIEFGPIAQLISGYFDYDKSLQSSIEL
jgi:predicted membrane protein